jgi:hypothetical protein
MNLSIYAICYNEEHMMRHFVNHYRNRFPDCSITIFDNHSTDKSAALARALSCNVILYDTQGKLNDRRYLEIKNSCWKDCETMWALICDMDEHCVINGEQLSVEHEYGATLIRFEGHNMVSMLPNPNIDIPSIKYGVRAPSYDKNYLFRVDQIQDINYGWGCHKSNPTGKIVESHGIYPVWHYKYIDPDFMVARHAHYASRMSNENLQKGLGFHYAFPEDRIRAEFEEARKNAIKIR